jgi:Leucine-rich repeat (LRR) protein
MLSIEQPNGKRVASNGNNAADTPATATTGPQITTFPDAVLLTIFKHVPTNRNKVENRHALPLVCKKFWKLMKTDDAKSLLWTDLTVTIPTHPGFRKFPFASLYSWALVYGAHVTSLTVEISGIEGWTPCHALLGSLGPRLTSLRIYSDNDDAPAFDPKNRAPWLALTPKLKALELEGVVDTSIEKALMPAGLTHLALNGCGQTGLTRIPPKLATLSLLHCLSLQFMDQGADLEGLASLKHIRHLDLSNCSLSEIPGELTEIKHLSSLTLNDNEELGGRNNAARVGVLAMLPNLAVLEMRDCGLKAVPQSITNLTSLRTLLLGYNDFSGVVNEGGVIIPPGPYLSSLELLAMSDCIPETTNIVEALIKPLAAATSLQVLRINRNWGINLNTALAAALLKGKPRFRKLEYSEDMGVEMDVRKLKKVFPGVTFKVVE